MPHTRSPGNSGATSTARSTTLSPPPATEAQKLRTDARVATYLKTGVHYLEYIAVGDDVTRPEHLARTARSTRSIRPRGSGTELPVYPHRR